MSKKKGKKKKDALMKRSEKVELASQIHELMIEGNTDGDIIDELGITPQDFAIGKKFLLMSIGEAEELKTSKERFAEYLVQVQRNTAELDDLVTNLNSKTQYNVILGAIRLRAELQDKLISTGQTLGVIDKEPERKVLVGGIAVGDLPDKDLRKGVVSAIAGLSAMFERYGDTQNVKELAPGQLHYGDAVEVKSAEDNDSAALGAPPIKESEKGKRNRAKSNKRSAGRRRVKEKK